MSAYIYSAVLVLASSLSALAQEAEIKVLPLHPALLEGTEYSLPVKISVAALAEKSGTPRLPLNLAFVLDSSSAINSLEQEHLYRDVLAAITLLRAQDTVSVVACHESTELLLPATSVADSQRILATMRTSYRGGTTKLFPGLSKAAREVVKNTGNQSLQAIIVIAAATPVEGLNKRKSLERLARSYGKDGISITTIGLGLKHDPLVLETLAESSGGAYLFAKDAAALRPVLEQAIQRLFSAAIPAIELEVALAGGVEVVQTWGNLLERSSRKLVFSLGPLRLERQRFVVLELKVPPASAYSLTYLLSASAHSPVRSGSRDWRRSPVELHLPVIKESDVPEAAEAQTQNPETAAAYKNARAHLLFRTALRGEEAGDSTLASKAAVTALKVLRTAEANETADVLRTALKSFNSPQWLEGKCLGLSGLSLATEEPAERRSTSDSITTSPPRLENLEEDLL